MGLVLIHANGVKIVVLIDIVAKMALTNRMTLILIGVLCNFLCICNQEGVYKLSIEVTS